jgi:predicted cupin superfamily sugar epimerase
MKRPTAKQLVEHFDLKPLPVEGGIFRQTYRSPVILAAGALPDAYQTDKPAGTAILLLYTPEADSFSALHRLPTDEIYHFYLGDPITLLLLDEAGHSQRITLGHDVLNGQYVQYTVPAGTWQGSVLAPGGSGHLSARRWPPASRAATTRAGQRTTL